MKQKLVNQNWLHEQVAAVRMRFVSGLTDTQTHELVAEYISIFSFYLNQHSWLGTPRIQLVSQPTQVSLPNQWLQSQIDRGFFCSKKARVNLSSCASFSDLIKSYQLKDLCAETWQGFYLWRANSWPLEVCEKIPTPLEMLEQQTKGRRYLTLLLAPHDQFKKQGRHPHALAFLLHDMEHAYKFFANAQECQGQIQFFGLLKAALEDEFSSPVFRKPLSTQMNYLLSDMNSHPVHLFKYLKALILSSTLRSQSKSDFLKTCEVLYDFWNFPEEVKIACRHINEPDLESARDHAVLAEYLIHQPIRRVENQSALENQFTT